MKRQVRELLEAGLTGRQIARRLGVSESKVSLIRRQLGLGVRRKATRFDWPTIQRFYDDDHTFAECCERFSLSGGAWDAAVKRGDLIPRGGNGLRRPGPTRDRVARLLEAGLSQKAIARELGLSAPTVSYHARRLGLAPDERFTRRYDWAEIQRYYDEGHTVTECQERFGFARDSWNAARKRGEIVSRPVRRPIEAYLVRRRKTNRYHLKTRLIAEGFKKPECEECGLTAWRGVPVPLALHHVNGDGLDNRLENLQLLCANCHGLTENFGVKNWRTRRTARALAAVAYGELVPVGDLPIRCGRIRRAPGPRLYAAACSAQSR